MNRILLMLDVFHPDDDNQAVQINKEQVLLGCPGGHHVLLVRAETVLEAGASPTPPPC